MNTYINYNDYKKYTRCKEIVYDVIRAGLLKNNIKDFDIYFQPDKFAKYAINDYPFEFEINIKNSTMLPDEIRDIIMSYFTDYKKSCSKIKISREEALFRYENDRINIIEKRVRERYRDNSFKIKTAIICYHEYITTVQILKGLYLKSGLKTDFNKWFKGFLKRYPHHSFKSDKEIDKIIAHDKEVLRHIKFMKSLGLEHSNRFSNYTVKKIN